MNITVISLYPEWYVQTIEMIQRTIRISQKTIYPPELIDKFIHKYDLEKFKIKARDIAYFIALDTKKNTVVGIIGLKDNEVRTFFVDPKYQGKGIGRLLYTHLEQVAKKRNSKKLFLFGSPLGEPVYLKFGFTKIRTVTKEFEGIAYTDAYMEKELLF